MSTDDIVRKYAKATLSSVDFVDRSTTRKTKFETLVELDDGKKTRVTRILAEYIPPNRRIQDDISGRSAKVIRAIAIQKD